MKNFVLIGVAGYIAPRHLQAIKETGNNLIAALDKNDSVGILDSFFPQCHFFTEFERFERHCEKVKRNGIIIDFVVVCSPNYLHDAHIRFGLRIGADVICEKPVVLNPWNVEALMEMEKESGKKVNCILQLRLHPVIVALKKKIVETNSKEKYIIDLKYITARGNWYHNSWKGEESKSGGIETNIGIHLFDMLIWIFGKVQNFNIEEQNKLSSKGKLFLENAIVNWIISIDKNNIYNEHITTDRSMIIDKEIFDFSNGFDDLHTLSYEKIFNNNGFNLLDSIQSIDLVSKIRHNKNISN